jgi:uncharacterized protein YbjT (DUF2867 family)
VVEQLLKKGHRVKAIGRDGRKLDYLKSRGAEVVRLEGFNSEAALTDAFKGVDGVFGMLPPGQGVSDLLAFQTLVGEATIGAVKKNSVRYLVNLSSIGAHLPEGTGPIKGLHAQEKRLDTVEGLNVVHLRPAFFMENFFWSIPVILQTSELKMPLNPELSLPLISTVDIGMKAAEFLDQQNFKGKTVFELAGPREIKMKEAATILGTAIGNPDLEFAQVPYDEVKQGMPPAFADLLIEMYKAFNDGKCVPTQKLTPEHQGKLTFEEFAKYFANAYKQNFERQKSPV